MTRQHEGGKRENILKRKQPKKEKKGTTFGKLCQKYRQNFPQEITRSKLERFEKMLKNIYIEYI